MPLNAVPQMMKHATQHGYAVGYFESWNLESLQAVIDAAEQSRSPVIIGFNGEFLSDPHRLLPERLSWYGALGKAAADSACVPCGLIFNECPHEEWVYQAVDCGFNLVMPVPGEAESVAAYTRRVGIFTQYAHQRGVAVEAELGSLPYGDEVRGGESTEPDRAAAFVSATGIDLLAVSVGNVHMMLHEQRTIDLTRLEAITKAVQIPLVLHGGTGISPRSLKEAIALGVAKVNYGTALKLRYLSAVRQALASTEPDPHQLLGHGGAGDVMSAGRRAVRDAVLEKMELLGCCGKVEDNGFG